MIREFHESKNLAAGTLNISKLVNSVTINSDSNGYFTVQGTSDSAGGRTSKISDNITLQSGTYRLTIGGSISCTLCVSNAADNAFITGFTNNGTFAINTETTIYFGLNFVNGNVYNDNFYIMLQPYTTDYPYEPYGDTWNTKSYAKIVDTTQQVTAFPTVVRPMENAIPSWTIKGNMVQDDTPSPSNIIYPSETGERTGNLFSAVWEQGIISSDTGIDVPSDTTVRTKGYISVNPNTIYSISRDIKTSFISLRFYDSNKNYIGTGSSANINLIVGSSVGNPMARNDGFCCFEIINSNIKYLRISDNSNDLSTKYMMVHQFQYRLI